MTVKFPTPAGHPSIDVLSQSAIEARAREHVNENRRVDGGHFVLTPEGSMPYKVVLHYRVGENTEHEFPTVRAGEAFIRSECPMPDAANDRRRAPHATRL